MTSHTPLTQIALTRRVSPSITRCQLTYMERDVIDLDRARRQHAAYEDALRAMGATVVSAPAHDDQPDCVFVEDTALVLDGVAILARMRRPSRAPETELLHHLLATQRPVEVIQAPGAFEGGDAFVVDKTIFIGLSTRTNAEGVEQVRAIAAEHGYTTVAVETPGCLHLTTGASLLTDGLILANPRWVDIDKFKPFEVLPVDESEPWAANTLRLNGQTLMGDCFPRTRERIEARSVRTRTTDISEFMKAEAGLTCMSLLFHGDVDALRAALPSVETRVERAALQSG